MRRVNKRIFTQKMRLDNSLIHAIYAENKSNKSESNNDNSNKNVIENHARALHIVCESLIQFL